MAGFRNSTASNRVQSTGGASVRLTRDKWITEIDAQFSRGAGELMALPLAAMRGNGWAARVDATETGYRFRTLLPHAVAAPVLAAIGL